MSVRLGASSKPPLKRDTARQTPGGRALDTVMVRASEVIAAFVGMVILMLPVAAVLAARRDRERLGRLGKTSTGVIVASIVLFTFTPVVASVLTPDWSPVTMFLIGSIGWAFSAWSAIFVLRFMNGASGRSSSLGAFGAAAVAPFLGTVMTVVGFII